MRVSVGPRERRDKVGQGPWPIQPVSSACITCPGRSRTRRSQHESGGGFTFRLPSRGDFAHNAILLIQPGRQYRVLCIFLEVTTLLEESNTLEDHLQRMLFVPHAGVAAGCFGGVARLAPVSSVTRSWLPSSVALRRFSRLPCFAFSERARHRLQCDVQRPVVH